MRRVPEGIELIIEEAESQGSGKSGLVKGTDKKERI